MRKKHFIKHIGLLIKPTSGKILIDSCDVSSYKESKSAFLRNSFFGYIVQDFALIEDYTVFENVQVPLLYSDKKIKAEEMKNRIIEALEQVGITKRLHTKASNLSGGQRQRVAIARAIVNNPGVILADEPTGSLDTKNSEIIFDLLHRVIDKNKALILVTHDKNMADKCDSQISLLDGKIVQGKTHNQLT